MSYDLTVFESDEGNNYLEQVNETDKSSMPRVTLVQAMSDLAHAGEAKPGQLIHNLTGEVLADTGKECRIIPLYYYPSRIMFPPRGNDTNVPLCASLNAKVGMGLPGGDCNACPKAVWGKDDSGKATKPACTLQHNFPVFLPDANEEKVAILTLSKTTFKTGRTMLNRMKSFKRAPMSYFFKVKTRPEEMGGNKFWVVDVVPGESGRLETPIEEAFKEKEGMQLFNEAKLQADLFRESYNSALEAEQLPPSNGNASNEDDEVPF